MKKRAKKLYGTDGCAIMTIEPKKAAKYYVVSDWDKVKRAEDRDNER